MKRPISLLWALTLIATTHFSSRTRAECPQSPLRTKLETSVIQTPKDGVYLLQQSEASWEVETAIVTLQWLLTPIGPVVSNVCPDFTKIEKSQEQFLIRTETLLGSIQVRDGKLYLVDGSDLFDVTALIVDQEVHTQESRKRQLSLENEGLSDEALQTIPSLKIQWLDDGMIVQYLNVIALYRLAL